MQAFCHLNFSNRGQNSCFCLNAIQKYEPTYRYEELHELQFNRYFTDNFFSLKQKIHKDDPVEVSNQYLFGSHFRSQDTTHALSTLLESQSCTRVKIILSLTNPTQARDLLENYTTGHIPYDNKDVEIYLIVEKGYGDVCFQ